MLPSFWEQNANWIVPLSFAALLAIALLVWYFLRSKTSAEIPPELRARLALEKLATAPPDRDVLSNISQILKRYLAEVFALPKEEMTTSEFCAALTARSEPGKALTQDVCRFLRQNDQ